MRFSLLVLLVFILSACAEKQSSAEDHLSRAKDYLLSTNSDAAEIELKNVLQRAPANGEARFLLGSLYLDKDQNPAAEKELLRAQELGWSADVVRPALARSWLGQAKNAEVLALDYTTLADTTAARLLCLQAIAALMEGKRAQAVDLVALARTKDPQSFEAKTAEARILALQGDAKRALSLIEDVLAAAPQNAEAWRLKANILSRQQKLEEARAAFDQSIANSSVSFTDHLYRGLISIQLQDFAKADADAAQLVKLSPENPGTNYIQGLLAFRNKQYRHAITYFTRAEYASSKYPALLFYLSLAHLLDGNLDLGAQSAQAFIELAPDDIAGRKLLAVIHLRQQHPGEAQKMLQPVLDYNPNDIDALNIQANALLLGNQADTGLVLFARISRLRPETPVAQGRLTSGILTAGLGLGADASTELEKFLGQRPENPLKEILLIVESLQKQDFAQAIAVADSYRWRNPNDLAPYNVLGNVYLAAGRPEDARKILQKVLDREPGNASANLLLATMARDAGDAKLERQLYKTVLEHDPGNVSALLRLAVLEGKEQNPDQLAALLKQAMSVDADALEPRLGLARFYLDSGNPGLVAPLFSNLGDLQQRSPRVLELYALAQLAKNEPASATLAVEQWLASNPQSAQAHYLLWQAASGAGDQAKAEQALAEALKLDPQHVPALIASADKADAVEDRALFEQHLATLVEVAPEDAAVLRLQARAERLNGNAAAAVTLAERAFKQDAGSRNFLELMVARSAAGQGDATRQAMLQWVQEHPGDVAVRLALSDDLQLHNDLSGAQAQYEEVLKLESDNVLALNNLAWLLRIENPAKALEHSRRASLLAPGEAAVLDTLAVIEHLNGENEVARESIERALAAAPGHSGIRYHQAMIIAALGDTQKAIASLEEILAAQSGAFPERAAVEELLNTLRG